MAKGREAVRDAWRNYLGVALGVTESSRKNATKVVRRLVGKGEATAEQLQSIASDLLATGSENRDAIAKLVRFEVDRALERVGLATRDEVVQLTTKVRELEDQLRQARGDAAPVEVVAPPPPARKAAKKAVKKAEPGAAEPAHPVPAGEFEITEVAGNEPAAVVAEPVTADEPVTVAEPTAAEEAAVGGAAKVARKAPAKKVAPAKATKAAPDKGAPDKAAPVKGAPDKAAPVKAAAKKAPAKKAAPPEAGS